MFSLIPTWDGRLIVAYYDKRLLVFWWRLWRLQWAATQVCIDRRLHRYNIIFHWSKCSILADNGDLEGARRLLVEELDTLAAMRGWTVTVRNEAVYR